MKTLTQILLFGLLLVFASCEETKPTDEMSDELAHLDTPDTDCKTAPAAWFIVENGKRVTPKPNEGDHSVFANNKSVSNCDFHKWSWQKFLWLTNETASGRPFFLDNMNQVSSIGAPLGKGGPVILTDTGQATGSQDFLKTPGSSSSTVYYSIMANDALYNAIKTYAKLDTANPQNIVDLSFPVGALEMKSSWIDSAALGANADTYFITDALVGAAKTPTRVALLGIHVVGVVKNHPEFVWATFEHEKLAPMYDWSAATPGTDAPVTSGGNAYPFFGIDGSATYKNISSKNGINTDVFSLYKYGIPVEKVMKPLSPKVQILDTLVDMKTCQNADTNRTNISELNASVKKQLIAMQTKKKSIWSNYFYNGSIWVDTEKAVGTPAQVALLNSLGGTLGDVSPGKLPRGSVAVYNITMETYVQDGFLPTTDIHDMKVGTIVNCFGCHSTHYKGSTVQSPLQISHLYNGYVGALKGLTKNEVKEENIATFRENALLRR